MLVRHVSHRSKVDHITGWITDGLTVDSAGIGINQRGQVSRVIGLCEAHLNPLSWQHMGKKRVGPAIELRRRHDIVTMLSQRLDGIGNR